MSNIFKNFKFDSKPIIIDTSKSIEKTKSDATSVLAKLQHEVNQLNNEIKKAKKEAELILTGANNDAARIRQEAEQFKQEEIEKTKKICHEIEEDTRRQAFDRGFAEGKEEAGVRAKSILESLDQVLQQALSQKDDIIKNSEQQIVELSMAIAKKVVKCEVTLNRDIIFYSVNEAISKIVDKDTLNIYVNLKDLNNFTQKKDEILKSLPVGSKVKIIDDKNIETGGCVISTNMGNIDATISSQLLEIEKLLEEAAREEDGIQS
ncbi:MAG: FliH/SctL family protein [Candidatus Wallbacteria bacterium]